MNYSSFFVITGLLLLGLRANTGLAEEAEFSRELNCIHKLQGHTWLPINTQFLVGPNIVAIHDGAPGAWIIYSSNMSYKTTLNPDPKNGYEVPMITSGPGEGSVPGPVTLYQIKLPNSPPVLVSYRRLFAGTSTTSNGPIEILDYTSKQESNKAVPKIVAPTENLGNHSRQLINQLIKTMVAHTQDAYKETADRAPGAAKPFLDALESCKSIEYVHDDVVAEEAKLPKPVGGSNSNSPASGASATGAH